MIQTQIDIVASTQTAINDAIAARNATGWTLSGLVDKPATNEVYLLFVLIQQPS